MPFSSRIRYAGHISACALAIAAAQAPASSLLVFTRPTTIATTASSSSRADRTLFEDQSFRFAIRDRRQLVVYSKERHAAVVLLRLSTEHGRFGHAPLVVQLGWEDGGLINEEFATLPLEGGRLPDRAIEVPAQYAYRLEYGTALNREDAITSFWLRKLDLDAAFRGEREPIILPPRNSTIVDAITDPILFTTVRTNARESLWWSVDTASARTVIDTATVRRDPSVAKQTVPRVDLSIGGVRLDGIEVEVSHVGMKQRHAVGGALGAMLFERFAVRVDYDRRTMELLEPGAVTPGVGVIPVTVDWRENVPVVRVPVALSDGRTIRPRLVIDSGEPRPLVLYRSFVAAERVDPTARAASLRLGAHDLHDLPIAVSDRQSDHGARWDGAIGSGLLRRFRVTFDRLRSRVLLEPGALLGVPYEYDSSGLRIVANGREFGIGDLVPGYASSAGFRVGDIIVAIDGRSVAGSTLADVRRGFKSDGRDHTLTIARYGAIETVIYRAPAALTPR